MSSWRRRTDGRAAIFLSVAVSLLGAGTVLAVSDYRGSASRRTDRSFGWLSPQPVPASWRWLHTAAGSSLPYPRGWSPIRTDRGTASAALVAGERFVGYLNLTPRQGDERLHGWAAFRIDHNREEGDRGVRLLRRDENFPVGAGRGSCVQDAYVTRSGGQYIEIACLLEGQRTAAVAVGAAPPSAWPAVAPLLQRAVAGVRVS